MDKVRFGVSRDLQQLKEGASASAVELREFLKDMKGKNPHEVLGLIAQSSFVQALVVATIGTVAVLAVGTIVPYALYSGKPAVVAAAPGTVQPSATPTPATPGTTAAAAGGTGTNAAGPGTPYIEGQPSMSELDGKSDSGGGKSRGTKKGDVLDRLGLGEDKMADPDVNPLDKGDDLLKGLN